MSPIELKGIISSGLLSFPVTDFDAKCDFDPKSYAARLEWLMPFGASALFSAGGTGELFSLTPGEYSAVIGTAVSVCRGRVPIIAGAGGPTRVAIKQAQQAEELGAHGVLLLPHYLTEASQEGIADHVAAVCGSVKFGVIVYNRANSRLTADTIAGLTRRCPNLVGFKDGVGDIELMVTIRRQIGDRLAYLGGLPTAEIYAAAYKAIGVPVYSSAVFNFVPQLAMDFYQALAKNDQTTVDRLIDRFFLPYLAIRNRSPGYAVSIIKAGVRLVGHGAGPVRTPLTDLLTEEVEQLRRLIAAHTS